jgi:hypothetical protein
MLKSEIIRHISERTFVVATASKDSTFSSADIQFLLTFALGMAAFWLSGRLPGYLPVGLLPHNYLASFIVNLVLALIIYGAVMFGWAWLILGSRRSLKSALAAGIVAIVLGLASSLALTALAQHHLNIPLALLAFILYLVYGIYFVIGWAVARRIAK